MYKNYVALLEQSSIRSINKSYINTNQLIYYKIRIKDFPPEKNKQNKQIPAAGFALLLLIYLIYVLNQNNKQQLSISSNYKSKKQKMI